MVSLRRFLALPLATRLNIVVSTVGLLLTAALLWLLPGVWGGRSAVAGLVLTGLGLAAASFYSQKRYHDALMRIVEDIVRGGKGAAEFIASPGAEQDNFTCTRLKRWMQSDLYVWKVGGRYPFVVGQIGGFAFSLRAPYAVQFERWLKDTTRIALYYDSSLRGFTVYRRDMLPAKATRLVSLDEPGFDESFAVVSRSPDEVYAVMDEAARRAVIELGNTGVSGIEVTRWGVFYHVDGKISRPGQALEALPHLQVLASSLETALEGRHILQ